MKMLWSISSLVAAFLLDTTSAAPTAQLGQLGQLNPAHVIDAVVPLNLVDGQKLTEVGDEQNQRVGEFSPQSPPQSPPQSLAESTPQSLPLSSLQSLPLSSPPSLPLSPQKRQFSLPPVIPAAGPLPELTNAVAPPLPVLQIPTPPLPNPGSTVNDTIRPRKFAYVWTGAGDNKHADFLVRFININTPL